jgi:hypothetical protein
LDAQISQIKDQFKDFDAVKAELKKLKDAGLSDAEKLQQATRDAEAKAQAAEQGKIAAEVKFLKTTELLAAGAEPAKIPQLIDLLQGATEAEIKKNIETLKAFGAFQAQTPGASGGGHPPPPAPGTPKDWTEAEIADLVKKGEYGKHRDEILKAYAEGRVK